MFPAVPFLPDLGRTAAFDDEEDLLVHVPLGMQGAHRRHLDDITAPLGLGAVELDEVALAAGALPRHQRQVLHLADADVAEHRNALRFHERVVGRGLLAELSEAGLLAARRLVPVGLILVVRHVVVSVVAGGLAPSIRPRRGWSHAFLYEEQCSYI